MKSRGFSQVILKLLSSLNVTLNYNPMSLQPTPQQLRIYTAPRRIGTTESLLRGRSFGLSSSVLRYDLWKAGEYLGSDGIGTCARLQV